MSVQQAVGPVLVTTMLTAWGRLGWLALVLLLTASTLASRRLGTRQMARRLRPATQTPPGTSPATDELQPDQRPIKGRRQVS